MSMIGSFARVALGVFLGVPIVMYLIQDSMLFYPQPPGKPLNQPNSEPVTITTPDGVKLHGWLVKGRQEAPAPLVIYFGGNAEEVSYLAAMAEDFGGWSLLLVNYRGYGKSEGRPGERELFADALTIYDYARERTDVLSGRIVAMGRSLGSGVAVHLAAHRPLSGVILVTPYDSIVEVARRYYPFLPVSLMLRHRFDSLPLASRIPVPLLCLAAGQDRVVPVHHAQRLFAAWAGPKSWLELPRARHESISDEPGYWAAIGRFLKQRLTGVPPVQSAPPVDKPVLTAHSEKAA